MLSLRNRRPSPYLRNPPVGVSSINQTFIKEILNFWTFNASGPFDHISQGKQATGTYVTPANIAFGSDGVNLGNTNASSAYAQVTGNTAQQHLTTVGFVGLNFTLGSGGTGNNPYLMTRASGSSGSVCEYRLEFFSGSFYLTVGNAAGTSGVQTPVGMPSMSQGQRITALAGWDPAGYTLFIGTPTTYAYLRSLVATVATYSNHTLNIAIGGIDTAQTRNLIGTVHWAIVARSPLDDTIGKRLHLSGNVLVPALRRRYHVGATAAATLFRRGPGGAAGRRRGLGSSGGL